MFDTIRDDLETLRTWSSKKQCEIRHYGIQGVSVAAKELVWQGSLRISGKYALNYGTPIFEREWDVLVVLDSCRADLMAEVAPEYDYLPTEITTTKSVGSFTREWMDKNFGPDYADEISRTTYVTGNPFSDRLNPTDWAHLVEVWREYRNEIDAIPPRPITDHAIEAAREFDSDRLIVHYMQPHQPFRSLNDFGNLPDCLPRDIWRLLQFGEVDADRVWNAYRDNLRWVLDDLDLLVEQLDDHDVVITSDHGNAVGEWGTYGHARYLPVPQMKQVPWIRPTSMGDPAAYEPTETMMLNRARTDTDVNDRLKALGYR